MSNTWSLGSGTCHAAGLLQFNFAIADITMVCSLTVCKLLCLIFPLRSSVRSTKSGYILVLSLWIISLMYPLETIAFGREVVYDTELYRCVTGDSVGTWNALIVINTAVLMLIPLLVITSNETTSNNQGVLVVITVAIVFSLSWCPMMSYNFFQILARPSKTFYKIAAFSVFINTASNPFLYMLTSRSYKEFIFSRILRCCKVLIRPACAQTYGVKCEGPIKGRLWSVECGNFV
ncbi:hypothetical protein ACHWQZ_G002896 [Mnemiopsis leidyi]